MSNLLNIAKTATQELSKNGALQQLGQNASNIANQAKNIANTMGNAKNQLGSLVSASSGDLLSGESDAMNMIQGIMQGNTGATHANTEANAAEEQELTMEEKKLKVLQAYYDIISSQKDAIRKQFTEGLRTYVDTHLTVKNDKLTEFMEKVLYNQMKEYFDTINTSYVQHAVLSQIFAKNKDLLLKILQNSISQAGILPNTSIDTNAFNILDSLRDSISEFNTQDNLIRGGGDEVAYQGAYQGSNIVAYNGGDASSDKYISEIASWFPLNQSIEDVNSDINYVIQTVFVETMREKKTLENVVAGVLSKHMCIMMKALQKIVNNQTLQLDMAMLQASISGEGDIRDTILQAIMNALREYKNENTSGLSSAIYYNIVSISDNKYKKEMANSGHRGGKRRTKKTRKYNKRRRAYTRNRK